jgi:hypothetical protein
MGYYEERASLELTVEQLSDAIEILDRKFGQGFSEKNPNLVGSLMNSISTNYLASAVENRLKKIAEILERG